MHECPIKDRDQDLEGKNVLHPTINLDDEGSEDFLNESCFMVIEEEKEEDFERVIE